MNLAARVARTRFVVVLSDADRRAAFTHARRIATAIRADPLLSEIGLVANVGIATFNARLRSPGEMIRAAHVDLHNRKTDRGARLSI
jgi:GGDEF domain-containing protein